MEHSSSTEPSQSLGLEAYTIGIVCALEIELSAARQFLDEWHDTPAIPQGDPNQYCLGKMGHHYVVIGCLPSGRYGLSPATHVATHMLRTFENVKIGLMVGIGGGVPKSKDIRLGDVVVSHLEGQSGGVWQYDRQKDVQEKGTENTSFLNAPPTQLLTALTGLKSDYHDPVRGLKAGKTIDDILRKVPQLVERFGKPDPDTDILYRKDFVHRTDEGCPSACGNQPEKLVERQNRKENHPYIHYGLIASGNTLCKNAEFRDNMAEKGVLCFEMESAGLMNDFPCLVIRGICDYSDSHKNKMWQPYAALSAAAFARDLLTKLHPAAVQSQARILDIVNYSSRLQEIQSDMGRLVQKADRDEVMKILEGPTHISFKPQHKHWAGRRAPGTGDWFLESVDNWLSGEQKTLFCTGIPGAGKSVITSRVIDHLHYAYGRKSNFAMAYVYFENALKDEWRLPENSGSGRRERSISSTDLLMSVLTQFAACQPLFPQQVRELHDRYASGGKPPAIKEVYDVLVSLLKEQATTVVVVDALDECKWDVCEDFLSNLFKLQDEVALRLFATSQPIEDIREQFRGKDCLGIKLHAHDGDIREYMSSRMPELDPVQDHPELEREVETAIIKASDGMFLLAELHMTSLNDKLTEDDLKTALQCLHAGEDAYKKAYDGTMKRIESKGKGLKDLAIKVLSWITCARRRLTIDEIHHAIAIRPGTSELKSSAFPKLNRMIAVCEGLVTIDEERRLIGLVHGTTYTYFNARDGWLQNAHAIVTKASLTYLMYDVFGKGIYGPNHQLIKWIRSFPLYKYVAQHWGDHAREASETEPLVEKLLQDHRKLLASYQGRALRFDISIAYRLTRLRNLANASLPVLTAAYFGLEGEFAKHLDPSSPNPVNELNRTPLSLAAAQGHVGVVKTLLALATIKVDHGDFHGRTPLALAARKGHKVIVDLLLHIGGADRLAKDKYGFKPLDLALLARHKDVVKSLIGSDVDIDSLELSITR